MHKEKYIAIADPSYTSFKFVSKGSKGEIIKLVTYEHLGGNIYNLAFGDWNGEIYFLNDLNISNNGDKDKVLTTVAHTVLTFIKHYPFAEIFLKGSTQSRTRLYQMGIILNIAEITASFDIFGSVNGSWEPFKKSKNYDSFYIKYKKSSKFEK